MRKIRKDDKVIVLTGKDKGKTGTVLRADYKNQRLLVKGVNLVKKHARPNPQKGVTGGIIDKEASIHASNVALYNSSSKKGERVGFKALKDGKKVRVYRRAGEVTDV